MTVARTARNLVGALAGAGFVASVAVHVAALAGIDVASRFPAVWGLHIGIFIVFFPFVFIARKEQAASFSLLTIARALPPWVATVGAGVFVYALVNFAVSMIAMQGGHATAQGNEFVLLDHGHVVRKLTQAEFSAFNATQLRAFSGHWMLFYYVPAAYFLFYRPAPAPDKASDTATSL